MADTKFYEVTYLAPEYNDQKGARGNKVHIVVSFKSKKTILPLSIERASDLMSECEIKGFAFVSQTKDSEVFLRYSLGTICEVRIKENPNIKKVFISEDGKFTILSLVPLTPQKIC